MTAPREPVPRHEDCAHMFGCDPTAKGWLRVAGENVKLGPLTGISEQSAGLKQAGASVVLDRTADDMGTRPAAAAQAALPPDERCHHELATGPLRKL
jgi:hypothetical protein